MSWLQLHHSCWPCPLWLCGRPSVHGVVVEKRLFQSFRAAFQQTMVCCIISLWKARRCPLAFTSFRRKREGRMDGLGLEQAPLFPSALVDHQCEKAFTDFLDKLITKSGKRSHLLPPTTLKSCLPPSFLASIDVGYGKTTGTDAELKTTTRLCWEGDILSFLARFCNM